MVLPIHNDYNHFFHIYILDFLFLLAIIIYFEFLKKSGCKVQLE